MPSKISRPRTARDTAVLWIAGLAYVGRCPVASGTAATLVWGVPLYALAGGLNPAVYVVLLAVLCALGIWASGRAEEILNEKDSSFIVLDELAGYLVAVALLPFHWKTAVWGFFLFRMFDIVKPEPARWAQSHAPGGWGVVLDDLVAGAYSNLILRGILWLFPGWIQG